MMEMKELVEVNKPTETTLRVPYPETEFGIPYLCRLDTRQKKRKKLRKITFLKVPEKEELLLKGDTMERKTDIPTVKRLGIEELEMVKAIVREEGRLEKRKKRSRKMFSGRLNCQKN